MKRDLSDEQFDHLMRSVMHDASADDADISEIADSPALLWNVRRQINEQKAAKRMPWPPSKALRRWLIGVPAFAAVLLAALFVLMPTADESGAEVVRSEVAQPAIRETNTEVPSVTLPTAAVDPEPTDTSTVSVATHKTAKGTVKKASKKATVTSRPSIEIAAATPSPEAVKTEFIALSYARNPDSGQIVRVKVPSSMMVTLGLVSTVEKPSALIDAEVVVGDDGLSHAIRFIR